MLRFPAFRLLVVKRATPDAFSIFVASTAVPSRKVIVSPVVKQLTVAVNVTAWSRLGGLQLGASVTPPSSASTLRASAFEVLPAHEPLPSETATMRCAPTERLPVRKTATPQETG